MLITGDILLEPDTTGDADCIFVEGAVECDGSLQTAVYISLFTDAEDTDNVTGQRRGWWGDTLDDYGNLGSRIWTLARRSVTTQTLSLAKSYCQEALQWLLDSGAAASVNVTVEQQGLYGIAIEADITMPSGSSQTFEYAVNWQYQATM